MIYIGRPCLECRTQSGNSVGENSLLIFSKVGLGEDVSGLFNLLGKIDGTATLFAFFHHEVNALCEKTGADVDEVAYVMGKDRRIGPKFLKASIGFGGSCFKKDILNLVYLCGYYGLPEVAAYWESVVKINEWQTHRVVDRMLETMFNTIAGKKIAVFGFAFKANTGDTRESPANLVVRDLLAEHAQPVVTDPKAIPDAKRAMRSNSY